MTKTNVCCNVVPKTQLPSSSIKQAQGVCSCKFWCCRSAPSQAFILYACCLLQQTKPHNTPSIAQTQWVIASAASYNQISEQEKQVKMCGLWTTKSTCNLERRFSCYSKLHAKERSSDRSPVWRSLFCVKLRVIEKKKRFCVCVVCFRRLC